jgi:hypothetical protein
MVKEALFPSWLINDAIHYSITVTLTGITRQARYCGSMQSVPVPTR